jgi:uncharacterized protein (TIGR03067 family)
MDGDGVRGYTVRWVAEGRSNWVDLIRPDKTAGTVTRKGIWKIVGDRLLICTAPPGEPRPTKFAVYQKSQEGETDTFRRAR